MTSTTTTTSTTTLLAIDCANQAQFNAGLKIPVSQFLELENVSSTAMAISIAESLDALGGESPVLAHIQSLAQDFGILLPEGVPGFSAAVEVALASYLNALWAPGGDAVATAAFDALVALLGHRLAEKIGRLAISTAGVWSQDGVDELAASMAAGRERFEPRSAT